MAWILITNQNIKQIKPGDRYMHLRTEGVINEEDIKNGFIGIYEPVLENELKVNIPNGNVYLWVRPIKKRKLRRSPISLPHTE